MVSSSIRPPRTCQIFLSPIDVIRLRVDVEGCHDLPHAMYALSQVLHPSSHAPFLLIPLAHNPSSLH